MLGPLVERYRPNSWEDVVGQKVIVKVLQRLSNQPEAIPNLLFSGPSGNGKTTCAKLLAKSIFDEDWKMNFLDRNASDDRGIDFIRDTIKRYAKTAPASGTFKFVFLDEADSITKDAQAALRRIMEDNLDTCRFILSCNHPNKIIEAIRSRCAELRFRPLKEEDIIFILRRICNKEDIEYADSGLEDYAKRSQGDLRLAINRLQFFSTIGGVTTDNVNEVLGDFTPTKVHKLLDYMFESQLTDEKLVRIDQFCAEVFYNGATWEEVLDTISHYLLTAPLTPSKKVKLLSQIGQTAYHILVGANPMLQLRAHLYQIECEVGK